MSAGRAILLGCATSTGVPIVGCKLPACTSGDPHNRRMRASLWFEIDGVRGLVDTSTDLRLQALDNHLPGVDAVYYTHTHADHVHGIDDLRMFNFLQRRPIPCYAAPPAAAHLRRTFPYIFDPDPRYPSPLPRILLEEFDGPIAHGEGHVVPVPILHGRERIHGFRIGTLAYLTDISGLPDEAWPLLDGVETAVIGALRHEPHPKHLSVAEAVELAERLGVARAVLTHMSPLLEYQRLRQELPGHVVPGYDGMPLRFTW